MKRSTQRKPRVPSAKEWADSAPRRRPGSPCWLCEHPEAAAWAVEASRCGATQRHITAGLRQFFGYPHAGSRAAGHHIREHGGSK